MKTQTTRLRTVALPAEHGGWALILEPIVLGLLLAPSRRGLCIGLASFCCFLTRHPLKLALGDRRRGRRLPRTAGAERFTIIYATMAVLLFAIAIVADARSYLLPLLLALPLALIQLTYDSLGQSRKALPEISGAIGVGSIATAIALAGGCRTSVAFALWAIVAGRNVSTILYLRTRLGARRRVQGWAARATVILAQLATLVIILVLAWRRLVPVLAVGAFIMLALRAVIGLLSPGAAVTPKRLGIAEVAFGAITVGVVTLGYRLGW